MTYPQPHLKEGGQFINHSPRPILFSENQHSRKRAGSPEVISVLTEPCPTESDLHSLSAYCQQVRLFQAWLNDHGRLMRTGSADDAQRDAVHLTDHRTDLVALLQLQGG